MQAKWYNFIVDMKTEIIEIDKNNIDKTGICRAADIIRDGGLVAFPTETVYGLGANALSPQASRKIYEAKGRPSDNPLILHIASMDDMQIYAGQIPDKAYKLARRHWPGAITFVLKKTNIVPYETTGGLDTVAIRMPSHNIARELIERSGVPIAAPSANLSGKPSPTKASHVFCDMNGRIDMIIDGGMVPVGLESTIVDFTCDVPTILRSGAITKAMIENVIGDVLVDRAIISKPSSDIKPKAPGMKYRHYAPRAELTVVEGDEGFVISKINELSMADRRGGRKVGIIASEENHGLYTHGEVLIIGSRRDEETIALNLFDILRRFDDMGVDVIYSESFHGEGLYEAIMNRLVKAAGYKVINQ